MNYEIAKLSRICKVYKKSKEIRNKGVARNGSIAKK